MQSLTLSAGLHGIHAAAHEGTIRCMHTVRNICGMAAHVYSNRVLQAGSMRHKTWETHVEAASLTCSAGSWKCAVIIVAADVSRMEDGEVGCV